MVALKDLFNRFNSENVCTEEEFPATSDLRYDFMGFQLFLINSEILHQWIFFSYTKLADIRYLLKMINFGFLTGLTMS